MAGDLRALIRKGMDAPRCPFVRFLYERPRASEIAVVKRFFDTAPRCRTSETSSAAAVSQEDFPIWSKLTKLDCPGRHLLPR